MSNKWPAATLLSCPSFSTQSSKDTINDILNELNKAGKADKQEIFEFSSVQKFKKGSSADEIAARAARELAADLSKLNEVAAKYKLKLRKDGWLDGRTTVNKILKIKYGIAEQHFQTPAVARCRQKAKNKVQVKQEAKPNLSTPCSSLNEDRPDYQPPKFEILLGEAQTQVVLKLTNQKEELNNQKQAQFYQRFELRIKKPILKQS